MKFFVGLGNPEPKYSNNRHNVGNMVIDAINANFKTKYSRKAPVFSQKFLQSIVFDYSPFAILAKPMKFMNDSGIAVKKIVDAYKVDPNDLYIIHKQQYQKNTNTAGIVSYSTPCSFVAY